ncbi:hypothetical protein A8F94_21710 [Bacillus sp. FJAT-27225]|uniref:hypothetical protein n=1 Tax=Bacillus sp. FJAT-27225 TaxID=1743144 RepID=UPI00080C2B56|nr:hypothetical protein [Bacillus sp. FJAT-27225]OCA81497.1 hypothetical protein A8F94_21710 [Bacillus sp. FJAT-27225]
MEYNMRKALLLSENIEAFITFISKHQEGSLVSEKDKLYQLKLFIEEYKFQMIASELKRINQFSWDEKYSLYLVGLFKKGLIPIAEYIERNYSALFLFSGRVHILNSLLGVFE